MTHHLSIWITFADGARIRCGEVIYGEPDDRGRTPSEFRYSPEYLAHPARYPIDPESLPLGTGVTNNGLMVFEDSLPDDWGRKLLIRRACLPRGKQDVPNLLKAIGAGAMGALSYSDGWAKTPPGEHEQYGAIDLPVLMDTAERLENGEDIQDSDLIALLNAGSSPGGARPKALVFDQGRHWIAKFPSTKDYLHVPRIEAATLALAKNAGLSVPEHRLVAVGSKDALLVERFDVTQAGGRRHMISMKTMLRAVNWYQASYADIADMIRKHSSAPETDLPAIYRHMTFNALIGNTDDHLKNFAMICDESMGYRLSPSFDLLPDINGNREHVLRFGLESRFPGVQSMIDIGRRFGVARTAKPMVQEVLDTVSGWREVFEEHGVPGRDIDVLAQDIDRRCGCPTASPQENRGSRSVARPGRTRSSPERSR